MRIRTFLFLVLLSSASYAADKSDVFDRPAALFKEAYVPVMSGFDRARIGTTWRGFQIRADRQQMMPEDEAAYRDPSEDGIYLDIEVRDAEELPKFSDVTVVKGGLKTRTVKFPAPAGKPQGLLITLVYGPNADAKAIEAIGKCIEAIRMVTGA